MKRKRLEKIVVVGLAMLMTLSQINFSVFAEEINSEAITETSEQTSTEQTSTTDSEQGSVTVNPEQSSSQEKQVETNQTGEIGEQNKDTENKKPQVETKIEPTNESTSIASFKDLNNNIINLNGADDSVELKNLESSKQSQTLNVNVVFDGSSDVTSRKVEVKLANGLGFENLVCFTGKNKEQTDWEFVNPDKDHPYNGIITRANYTPNGKIKGVYQPKAGTVVYEFSQGITEVSLSFAIKSELPLNLTDNSLTIDNAISVKQFENGQVKQHETLERYVLNGRSLPVLYSNGKPTVLTIKPGGNGILTQKIADRTEGQNVITIDSMFVDKVTYTFEIDKHAGIESVELDQNLQEYKVDIDRSQENYDYVNIVIQGPLILKKYMELRFKFQIKDDAPVGTYTKKLSSAKVEAHGQTYDASEGFPTDEVYKINVVDKPQIEISNPDAKGSGTNVYANNQTIEEEHTTPLGGFHIVNRGSDSGEQKIQLKFDDPTIGVQGASLPFEKGGTLKDIVVKTNKNQEFTVAQPDPSEFKKTHDKIGFSRYDLFLKNLGAVANDEYITEITYNMGKINIGAGLAGDGEYRGSENMKLESQYAIALTYYGKLLSTPVSKTFSAAATIVDLDKEFDDESAVSAINEMKIKDAEYTTFSSTSYLGNNLKFKGGSTQTIEASFNISSFPYKYTSAAIVQGFDIYLREGNSLDIDKETISIQYGAQTYQLAAGNLKVIESIDNKNYRVYKIELPKVIMGYAKANSADPYPSIRIKYNVKVKSSISAGNLPAKELIYFAPRNNIRLPEGEGASGGLKAYNNADIYDVDQDGDVKENLGTLDRNIGIELEQQKDFKVTTAANLNDGPWVSYSFDSNEKIIDLNPVGKAKYQLSVTNSTGSDIEGYTALIPIPKKGEDTGLMPAAGQNFDPNHHLQKEQFKWTASLSEEIKPAKQSKLKYEILYATSYEIDKDSSNFKPWSEIKNKDEIRMIKVMSKSAIADTFSESIDFPIALTDPDADANAGEINIYSARIYRKIEGVATGYKPSEPIAIRLQTGVISGQAFNDTNRNGTKDAGEAGRNGVVVHAYEAGSSNELETTTTRTIDGVEGCYQFLGLSKLTNVDIVFDNPETKETIRFSPTTANGSTGAADAEHAKAVTANVTPSGNNFDQINVGLITPVTITFNAGKGSTATNKVQLFPNEKIGAQPAAELSGHSFKGWYTDEKAGTKVAFPYTVGTKDLTFYAHYEKNKYDVYFHNGSNQTKASVTYDDLISKPADPSKTGQNFIGWFTDPTAGHAWDFTKDKMPAEQLDLYARFGTASYKVTFDNGEKTTEQTYEYNTLIEKPAVDPYKKGHTFEGWFTAKTGGKEWNFVQDKMPGENLTLYARFKLNKYSVDYIVDGTTIKTAQVNYNAIVEDRPVDPTKEGHTFEGWLNEETGEKWQFNKDKMPDKGITLQAQFSKNSYDLTLDNEGKTVTQSVRFDELASEPNAPAKTGYTFVGWFDQKTSGVKWDFAANRMPAKNVTLHAQYIINKYHVTFDDQGTQTNVEIEYNGLLAKPAPDPQAAAGYEFVGWQAQNSTKLWNFANDKMPAMDLVLTAQFKVLEQIITLDLDGGTSKGPNQIKAPTDSRVDVDAIAIPKKAGYQFVGWFDEDTQISGVITMPVGGLTLKAHWEESDQVIHYDANGGTGVDSVVAKTNTVITLEDYVTTRDGYEFVGWFNEKDQQVTGEFTVPSSGATFIAKWKALDQSITFDVNGGDIATQPATIVQPTGAKVSLDIVSKPTKAGYKFVGWFDIAGEKYSGTVTMPAGGLTLIAQWEEGSVTSVTDQQDKNTDNKSAKEKTGTAADKKQNNEKALPNSGEQSLPLIRLIGLLLMAGVLFLFVKQRKLKNIK